MIQRIQTVYLFLAGLLVGLAAYFPLLDFHFGVEGEVARLNAFSWTLSDTEGVWQNVANVYSLGIAVVLTALLNVVIIFLFKNRKLQIKLTHYAFILKVALIAVLVYFVFIMQNEDLVATKPQIGSLFIAVSMVFDWLAVKAIRKDEALVRSIDRIR